MEDIILDKIISLEAKYENKIMPLNYVELEQTQIKIDVLSSILDEYYNIKENEIPKAFIQKQK